MASGGLHCREEERSTGEIRHFGESRKQCRIKTTWALARLPPLEMNPPADVHTPEITPPWVDNRELPPGDETSICKLDENCAQAYLKKFYSSYG